MLRRLLRNHLIQDFKKSDAAFVARSEACGLESLQALRNVGDGGLRGFALRHALPGFLQLVLQETEIVLLCDEARARGRKKIEIAEDDCEHHQRRCTESDDFGSAEDAALSRVAKLIEAGSHLLPASGRCIRVSVRRLWIAHRSPPLVPVALIEASAMVLPVRAGGVDEGAPLCGM